MLVASLELALLVTMLNAPDVTLSLKKLERFTRSAASFPYPASLSPVASFEKSWAFTINASITEGSSPTALPAALRISPNFPGVEDVSVELRVEMNPCPSSEILARRDLTVLFETNIDSRTGLMNF